MIKKGVGAIVLTMLFIATSCSRQDEKFFIMTDREEGTGYSMTSVEFYTSDGSNRDIEYVCSNNEGYSIISKYTDGETLETQYTITILDSDLTQVTEAVIDSISNDLRGFTAVQDTILAVDGDCIISIDHDGNVSALTDTDCDYADLIAMDDGYAIYSNGNLCTYGLKGDRQNEYRIETDGPLLFDYPMVYQNNKWYVVIDDCPTISFFEYDLQNGEQSFVCTNEDCGYLYSACYGEYFVNDEGIGKILFEDNAAVYLCKWNNTDIIPESGCIEKDTQYLIENDKCFYMVYEYCDGSAEVLFFTFDESIDYSEVNP